MITQRTLLRIVKPMTQLFNYSYIQTLLVGTYTNSFIIPSATRKINIYVRSEVTHDPINYLSLQENNITTYQCTDIFLLRHNMQK